MECNQCNTKTYLPNETKCVWLRLCKEKENAKINKLKLHKSKTIIHEN